MKYARGIIVLILLTAGILGPLLLMGKSEPTSIETYDGLNFLRDAEGLLWNGTQLTKAEYELETYENRFIVRYDESVAVAFIYLPSNILDRKPEYFLIRFLLKGEGNFIYCIQAHKRLESFTSALHVEGNRVFFLHSDKSSPDYVRLDTFNLKEAQREYQTSELVNDFMVFFTSNQTLSHANTNLIKEIHIFQFRVVYASEGLVSYSTITPQVLLLTFLPYIGLMIVLPITILYLENTKYGKFLDERRVLLVGVALRITLSTFTAHAYDMEIWKFATRIFYEHGEIALFSNWTSPPIFYFALILFYSPYALLYYYTGFNDWRFFYHPVRAVESLFIKMPMIIADVLIFILLIKIIHHIRPSLSKKQTVFLSSLYFLNPYVIMISSVWGMFDALAMVFIVAGIYMWLKEKYLLAGFLFAVSALTKWIGLAPLLFGTILLIRSRRFKMAIKMVTTSILGILAIFVSPFIVAGQIDYLLEVLAFRLGSGSNVTIWHGITYLEYFRLQDVFNILPNLLVSNYFSIFFGIFIVFLCIAIARSNPKNHYDEVFILVKGTLLAFLAFYLTYYRVNEQFLLWSVALLPLVLLSREAKEFRYSIFGWAMAGALPGLCWAMVEAISGQSLTYMMFGFPNPMYTIGSYEAGFSVVFSFLCIVMLWLLLGVGKRLSNLLFYRGREINTVRQSSRVLIYIILLGFTGLLSWGVTQTILAGIAPYLALAIIIVLFFVVAPFVAAVIEHPKVLNSLDSLLSRMIFRNKHKLKKR